MRSAMSNAMSNADNKRQSELNEELFSALDRHDLAMVRLALEAGAQVNCVNVTGSNPLLIAIKENDREIVRILLDRGSDVNAADKYGWRAIHEAVRNSADDLGVIRDLIEHGADVNTRNASGRRPLHFAAIFNFPSVCRFLLDEGADPNAKDNDDLSAIVETCYHGGTDCALLLIAYGAKTDGLTSSHKSISRALQMSELQAAASADLGHKVLELLDAGGDPTYLGKCKGSAIDLAVEFGFPNIVSIIKAHGGRKLAQSMLNEIGVGSRSTGRVLSTGAP